MDKRVNPTSFAACLNRDIVGYLLSRQFFNVYEIYCLLFINKQWNRTLEQNFRQELCHVREYCPNRMPLFGLDLNTKADTFQWVIENRKIPVNGNLFNRVAVLGNLDGMKYLKDRLKPLSRDTINNCFRIASRYQNNHVLQWMKNEMGYRWNAGTFVILAKDNNLSAMKWLRQQGCSWNVWTFEEAAKLGNLDMVRWLREEGCPWSPATFSGAIRSENLDVIQFLWQENCPMDQTAYDVAKLLENDEIVRWLEENTRICPIDTEMEGVDEATMLDPQKCSV